MLHGYLGDAKFWRILVRIDEDLAEEVRSVGGPHCRSVLHSARYPRKPRRGGSRRTRLRLRVSAESVLRGAGLPAAGDSVIGTISGAAGVPGGDGGAGQRAVAGADHATPGGATRALRSQSTHGRSMASVVVRGVRGEPVVVRGTR